jgi:hypothetical protein
MGPQVIGVNPTFSSRGSGERLDDELDSTMTLLRISINR